MCSLRFPQPQDCRNTVSDWRRLLHADPIPALLAVDNPALRYFVRRDLLDERPGGKAAPPQVPGVEKMLARQKPNGAWRYPGGGRTRIRSAEDYDQLETFRVLGELVEMYGLDRMNPAIVRAAEFLFSRQAEEGDFRGIYGNQYAPTYSAAITELLVKAGYAGDHRVDASFGWLLSHRQADGGWAIPLRTAGRKYDAETLRSELLQSDPSRPSSYLVTGMVLRAFAAHPAFRRSREGRRAGELLAAALFKRDRYPDRSAPSFWTRFSYPFWFTDLLSALDSLSLLGISSRNPGVAGGIEWFRARQDSDGLWRLSLLRMKREPHRDGWITLAIGRVLKRFYED